MGGMRAPDCIAGKTHHNILPLMDAPERVENQECEVEPSQITTPTPADLPSQPSSQRIRQRNLSLSAVNNGWRLRPSRGGS